jgi:uncharacterized protein YciI
MAEFIYFIRPKRPGFIENPTPEENAVMEAHFKYLKFGLETGTVILAGPCPDRSFGVVIFQAETEGAAQKFMSDDPSVKNGVMSAELSPFRVALMK